MKADGTEVRELTPIKTAAGYEVFPIQIERNGRLETINLTEPYYPGMKLPELQAGGGAR